MSQYRLKREVLPAGSVVNVEQLQKSAHAAIGRVVETVSMVAEELSTISNSLRAPTYTDDISTMSMSYVISFNRLYTDQRERRCALTVADEAFGAVDSNTKLFPVAHWSPITGMGQWAHNIDNSLRNIRESRDIYASILSDFETVMERGATEYPRALREARNTINLLARKQLRMLEAFAVETDELYSERERAFPSILDWTSVDELLASDPADLGVNREILQRGAEVFQERAANATSIANMRASHDIAFREGMSARIRSGREKIPRERERGAQRWRAQLAMTAEVALRQLGKGWVIDADPDSLLYDQSKRTGLGYYTARNSEASKLLLDYALSRATLSRSDLQKLVGHLETLATFIEQADDPLSPAPRWFDHIAVHSFYIDEEGKMIADREEVGHRSVTATMLLSWVNVYLGTLTGSEEKASEYLLKLAESDLLKGYEERYSREVTGMLIDPFYFRAPVYLTPLPAAGRKRKTRIFGWLVVHTEDTESGECVWSAMAQKVPSQPSIKPERLANMKEPLIALVKEAAATIFKRGGKHPQAHDELAKLLNSLEVPWIIICGVHESGKWDVLMSSEGLEELSPAEFFSPSVAPAVALFIHGGHAYRIIDRSYDADDRWRFSFIERYVLAKPVTSCGIGHPLLHAMAGCERIYRMGCATLGPATMKALAENSRSKTLDGMYELLLSREMVPALVKDCVDLERTLTVIPPDLAGEFTAATAGELESLLYEELAQYDRTCAKTELFDFRVRRRHAIPFMAYFDFTTDRMRSPVDLQALTSEQLDQLRESLIIVAKHSDLEVDQELELREKCAYYRIVRIMPAIEGAEVAIRDHFAVIRPSSDDQQLPLYQLVGETLGLELAETTEPEELLAQVPCTAMYEQLLEAFKLPSGERALAGMAVIVGTVRMLDGSTKLEMACELGEFHKPKRCTEIGEEEVPPSLALWRDPNGEHWLITGALPFKCRNVMRALSSALPMRYAAFDIEAVNAPMAGNQECREALPYMVTLRVCNEAGEHISARQLCTECDMNLPANPEAVATHFTGPNPLRSMVEMLEQLIANTKYRYLVWSMNGARYDMPQLVEELGRSTRFGRSEGDSVKLAGSKVLEIAWSDRMWFHDLYRFSPSSLHKLCADFRISVVKASANHELIQRELESRNFDLMSFKHDMKLLANPQYLLGDLAEAPADFRARVEGINAYDALVEYCQTDTDATLEGAMKLMDATNRIADFIPAMGRWVCPYLSSEQRESKTRITASKLVSIARRAHDLRFVSTGPSLAYRVASEMARLSCPRHRLSKAPTLELDLFIRSSALGGESTCTNFEEMGFEGPRVLREHHSVFDAKSAYPYAALYGAVPLDSPKAVWWVHNWSSLIAEDDSVPRGKCQNYRLAKRFEGIPEEELMDSLRAAARLSGVRADVKGVFDGLESGTREEAINCPSIDLCIIVRQPELVCVPLRVKGRPLNWSYRHTQIVRIPRYLQDLVRYLGGEVMPLYGVYYPTFSVPEDPTPECPDPVNRVFALSLNLWRLQKNQQDRFIGMRAAAQKTLEQLGVAPDVRAALEEVGISNIQQHPLGVRALSATSIDELRAMVRDWMGEKEATEESFTRLVHAIASALTNESIRIVDKNLSNSLLGKYLQRLNDEKTVMARGMLELAKAAHDVSMSGGELRAVHYLSTAKPLEGYGKVANIKHEAHRGTTMLTYSIDPHSHFAKGRQSEVKESAVSATMLACHHLCMTLALKHRVWLARALRGVETDGIHCNHRAYERYMARHHPGVNPYLVPSPIEVARRELGTKCLLTAIDHVLCTPQAVRTQFTCGLYRNCERLGRFRCPLQARMFDPKLPPMPLDYGDFENEVKELDGLFSVAYVTPKMYGFWSREMDVATTRAKGVGFGSRYADELVALECDVKQMKQLGLIGPDGKRDCDGCYREYRKRFEAGTLISRARKGTKPSLVDRSWLMIEPRFYERILSGEGQDVLDFKFQSSMSALGADRIVYGSPSIIEAKAADRGISCEQVAVRPHLPPITHSYCVKRIKPCPWFCASVKHSRMPLWDLEADGVEPELSESTSSSWLSGESWLEYHSIKLSKDHHSLLLAALEVACRAFEDKSYLMQRGVTITVPAELQLVPRRTAAAMYLSNSTLRALYLGREGICGSIDSAKIKYGPSASSSRKQCSSKPDRGQPSGACEKEQISGQSSRLHQQSPSVAQQAPRDRLHPVASTKI